MIMEFIQNPKWYTIQKQKTNKNSVRTQEAHSIKTRNEINLTK